MLKPSARMSSMAEAAAASLSAPENFSAKNLFSLKGFLLQ
jgi:hypothetical protein